MAEVIAVIPARLHSTRFPEKVIYPYHGQPLLYYVWREVKKARSIDQVIVATDSLRIKQAVEEFGGRVVKTSSRHATGSDRVAAVAQKIDGRIFINVQADNFGIKPAVLNRVVEKMKTDRKITYATLAYRLKSDSELLDPNIVKVAVAKKNNRALWFSRLPIPYIRDKQAGSIVNQYRYYGHIGIYFYRKPGLLQFARWKQSPLEKAESLEQLRILENDGTMKVFITSMKVVSIDVPKDVKKLASVYNKVNHG